MTSQQNDIAAESIKSWVSDVAEKADVPNWGRAVVSEHGYMVAQSLRG